jgi:hypothetical protein
VYCDNISLISLSKNHVFHHKIKNIHTRCHFIRDIVKNIDTRYHFIRELVSNGEIYLESCRSKDQFDHIFIKTLENVCLSFIDKI